jgi:DnaK suppressor protein
LKKRAVDVMAQCVTSMMYSGRRAALDLYRRVQQQEQRRCGTMELERARSLLDAERAQVQQLLADLGRARTDDHEAERDASYPAQPLAQQGVDDAVAAGLRDRLAALDRALQRVEDGSYGLSIRSGTPIPDERLEADPSAELTVQEAAADQAADR